MNDKPYQNKHWTRGWTKSNYYVDARRQQQVRGVLNKKTHRVRKAARYSHVTWTTTNKAPRIKKETWWYLDKQSIVMIYF